MKGFIENNALNPKGDDQGTTIPSKNIIFHVHVQVRWNKFNKRHKGQRVLVFLTISFSTKYMGRLGSERGVTIEVNC
jgi:hypothetical protein